MMRCADAGPNCHVDGRIYRSTIGECGVSALPPKG
jgi:hypothetical protein